MLMQMAFSTLVSIVSFLSLVGLDHYFQCNGSMTIFESVKAEITSEAHHIHAGIVSIILFFAMSIRIIWRIVSYIKEIEAGIKKLPDENTNYSIPIVGTNELAQLAQSVNEIKDELKQKTYNEKAHEAHRRMLITNISHDLRTPLTSIIGYLDRAKDKVSPHEEAYAYIEIAQKNSLRLKKLISDLFLYSKIISDDVKMDTKEVNVKFLLHQIVELKAYPVTLIHEQDELILSVDIENFNRIIDNLLENAHKYGLPEQGISIHTYKNAGETIIEMKNFTEEDLSSKIHFLTKRLYTVDESRVDSSSGLGLSIVTELMKRMQGKFHVLFEEKQKAFVARLSFSSLLEKSDFKAVQKM